MYGKEVECTQEYNEGSKGVECTQLRERNVHGFTMSCAMEMSLHICAIPRITIYCAY